MDMIRAEDIHVSFKNLEVLKGVSLSVKPQEVVCIIGPSGAGKSTFLRALNHLEHIKNGKIYIEDQLLTHHENGVRKLKINSKKRREILLEVGMVFQRFNLFPHKTALENIMIAPVTVLKKSKQEAREKGIELLNRVGLGDKINEYPSKLSGGQQQRVAIARALVKKPEVLLLDHMNIPYMNIGIGGHSRPYYLRTMLDAIAPHILVPLHSFRPEQVNTAHADKRILPEYGECFAFENGEMILKKN